MRISSKQCKRHRRTRRAVAAVEFAVCLPVIIMLVFGAIEASSFIFLKQSLNVAAYEGYSRVDTIEFQLIQWSRPGKEHSGCANRSGL